jgi:hypothetical protein
MDANSMVKKSLEDLKQLFPDWDDESLLAVLMANDFSTERTIESIVCVLNGEKENLAATELNNNLKGNEINAYGKSHNHVTTYVTE